MNLKTELIYLLISFSNPFVSASSKKHILTTMVQSNLNFISVLTVSVYVSNILFCFL